MKKKILKSQERLIILFSLVLCKRDFFIFWCEDIQTYFKPADLATSRLEFDDVISSIKTYLVSIIISLSFILEITFPCALEDRMGDRTTASTL